MRSGILLALLLAAAGSATCQGIITTVAGQGLNSCGPMGDGGQATSAQLCSPQGAAVDFSGNIYFYDWRNFRIRKIAPNGTITTIAGNGSSGTAGDGGPALNATLGSVRQMAIDPSGQRICFGDDYAYKIRCVFLSTGIIEGYGTGIATFGGAGDGGNVANASFYDPEGVAFDNAGNLYISDFADNRVRRVDAATNIITTYAGPGPGYCCVANVGDGGPAAGADLYEPMGLAYANGGLYIADTGNDRVRRVDSATGIIITVAGDGSPYDSGSSDGGPAVQAGVDPRWIAADASGNLFLETGTAVRMVNTAGIITTIAGTPGISGFGYDDIPATQTYFAGILGLGWDPVALRLLISEYDGRIREIFFTPPTTTALSVSPNPAFPGEQVTMIATVSPNNATGSVRFHQGNAILGSASVNNGIATFNWTPSGINTYGLTAVYGGDPTHNLSISGNVSLNVQLRSTSTTLSSSLNPSIFGSAITVSAAVTPSSATGSVQLFNGNTLLATATLAGGKAQYTIANLPAGSDSLTAAYSGDSSDAASTSAPLLQTVQKANSSTTVSANPASQSSFGQTVKFTAVVTPSAATGVVQFLDGSTVIGSATLSGGAAVFPTSSLAMGNHSIKASYGGNSNVNSSASAALGFKVKH